MGESGVEERRIPNGGPEWRFQTGFGPLEDG
jgi:hypothetical protein